MTAEIVWSARASQEYKKLLNYLYNEWGEAVALRVASDIDKAVTRIQNTPEIYPLLLK